MPDKLKLTLFDLDHTLLEGDSDVLWCDFLIDQGRLDRAKFERRNAEMARQYRAGLVSPHAFCNFYVATLAGHSAADWGPLRHQFLDTVVAPRISPAAHALVRRHRIAGDLIVLTTATNRFLTTLTAAHLGLPHLIATECETDADGRFTGRTTGTLNMREGKVVRLQDWLAARQIELSDCESRLYSDSINDLPLLQAVDQPVAVNPDDRLLAQAQAQGWPVYQLGKG